MMVTWVRGLFKDIHGEIDFDWDRCLESTFGGEIDATKLCTELGWRPKETFETGLRRTVEWYLANAEWVQGVQSGAYRDWVATQYSKA